MKLLKLSEARGKSNFIQSMEVKRGGTGALSKIGWLAVLVLACGGTSVSNSNIWAMDESAQARVAGAVEPNLIAKSMQEAFLIFRKHCVQCHNSVADPEKPGRTRAHWYAIINLMKDHGLEISQKDADIIANHLYNLRPADAKIVKPTQLPSIDSDYSVKD